MVSAIALLAPMIGLPGGVGLPQHPLPGVAMPGVVFSRAAGDIRLGQRDRLPHLLFGAAPVEVPASAVAGEAPPAEQAPPAASAAPSMPAAAIDAPQSPAGPAASTGPDITAEKALLDERRRPGYKKPLPDKIEQDNAGAVNAPPPEAFYDKYDGDGPMGSLGVNVVVPDRWRITSGLCPKKDPKTGQSDPALFGLFPKLEAVCHSTHDPFHHNVLKGDKPIRARDKPGFLHGDDWFFIVNAISDTIVEPRSFPQPVTQATSQKPNSIDQFSRSNSLVLAQTFITGVSLLKGLTAFKPPIVEYRLTLATQVNYASVAERQILRVKPSDLTHRTTAFVGVQEAFVDYHMARFDSNRYDFISVRAGIQEITADFRGFLFLDQQLGVRVFGDRDNNRIQFNLAAFWRLEKDTNSGLNDVTAPLRHDFVFLANIFRQDFPVTGLTSAVQFVYNRNREGSFVHVDKNGFPVRPSVIGDIRGHNYDVFYLGYGNDGHIGRINLSSQFYAALGHDTNNFLTSKPAKIQAFFGAAELSYDVDFMRFRLSGLYASGDTNPRDNTEGGFDSISENPQFAGADTSYYIRQSIPFVGGGLVNINQRNGILTDLRSSGPEGQSNFINPGTILVGIGGDFDLTPKIRVTANVNQLWFANTSSLQVLRNEGTIPRSIGTDASISATYRPKANQNIVFRLSGAVLNAGSGFKDLFASTGRKTLFYSVLGNAILAF